MKYFSSSGHGNDEESRRGDIRQNWSWQKSGLTSSNELFSKVMSTESPGALVFVFGFGFWALVEHANSLTFLPDFHSRMRSRNTHKCLRTFWSDLMTQWPPYLEKYILLAPDFHSFILPFASEPDLSGLFFLWELSTIRGNVGKRCNPFHLGILFTVINFKLHLFAEHPRI